MKLLAEAKFLTENYRYEDSFGVKKLRTMQAQMNQVDVISITDKIFVNKIAAPTNLFRVIY